MSSGTSYTPPPTSLNGRSGGGPGGGDPPSSSLTIASQNPGGLVSGEDEHGILNQRKIIQTGEELKALQISYGEADIFCAQESHIQEKDVAN